MGLKADALERQFFQKALNKSLRGLFTRLERIRFKRIEISFTSPWNHDTAVACGMANPENVFVWNKAKCINLSA